MSRYIDVDALIEDFHTVNPEYRTKIEWACRVVDSAPIIDIVRCKECRHWNEEDHWCNIRDSYGWDYKPDDFCSYGEREGE